MWICKECLLRICGVEDFFVDGKKAVIDKCGGPCGAVRPCHEFTIAELNQIKEDGDLLREVDKGLEE